MVTKNIKKILLNKDGNKFVTDIEDIENKITQNSSNLLLILKILSVQSTGLALMKMET